MSDLPAMFGGFLGLLFILLIIFVIILWIFVPFILLQIKNVLYKILYELQKKK